MDLLYSIAQAGPGGPCTEQAGLGWLDWAELGWAGLAGLQNAVYSVPEDSVPFGRGPWLWVYGVSPPRGQVTLSR